MASPTIVSNSKSTATTTTSHDTAIAVAPTAAVISTTPAAAAVVTPELPPLHQAAQVGDLGTLQSLLANKPISPSASPSASSSSSSTTTPTTIVTANDRDAQNITALHWAAINNQVLACKILLENGAEVDALGGDLNATPLHWAARLVCHFEGFRTRG